MEAISVEPGFVLVETRGGINCGRLNWGSPLGGTGDGQEGPCIGLRSV